MLVPAVAAYPVFCFVPHVERDEPLDGRDVVERGEEQPAMLERAATEARASACKGGQAEPLTLLGAMALELH
jgi:hypothetical protein